MKRVCRTKIESLINYWFKHVDEYGTYGIGVKKGNKKIILIRDWGRGKLIVKKHWFWIFYKVSFKIDLNLIDGIDKWLNLKWRKLDNKYIILERKRKLNKQLKKMKKAGEC